MRAHPHPLSPNTTRELGPARIMFLSICFEINPHIGFYVVLQKSLHQAFNDYLFQANAELEFASHALVIHERLDDLQQRATPGCLISLFKGSTLFSCADPRFQGKALRDDMRGSVSIAAFVAASSFSVGGERVCKYMLSAST